CFFFQAEDGIRDRNVTGVQTCALPISQSEEGKRSSPYVDVSAGTHLLDHRHRRVHHYFWSDLAGLYGSSRARVHEYRCQHRRTSSLLGVFTLVTSITRCVV